MTQLPAFRCGTAAIVGRPNVGKSTLLNALVGEKVAIVSPRPGTTRDKILGVLTRPDAQLLFLDTPGFGPAPTLLDKRSLQVVRDALSQADVLVVATDAAPGVTEEDRRLITGLPAERPVIVAINKIDRVAKPRLLPQIETLTRLLPQTEIIPISATTRDGLDRLIHAIVSRLPTGKPLFPADQFTDRSTRFLAAELIREQALSVIREEVPHALAVQIEEFVERRRRSTRRVRGHQRRGPTQPIAYLRATLLVERDSQKGIVIGAHGERLKAIGEAARKALEGLLGQPVYLDLWVKVLPQWRDRPQALKTLGY